MKNRRPFVLPHLRWWIAGLLFLASILNYIDRQALSILAPTIQADLHLSDGEYGNIISLFLVAYTAAYLLSGRIVDRLGARISFALFIGWWSMANAFTGLARSAASLGGMRFLLGLGEAGAYTASPKVVSEWFPPKERGVAVGIYSLGGSIGATLAPVLIIALANHYGWRSAFVVTGGFGLLFVLLWWKVYRGPREHPWLGDRERAHLRLETTAPTMDVSLPEKARWKAILSTRAVWILVSARMLTDPVWYFHQFWMPKYLHSVRGFSQDDLANLWLVFVAADLGFILSGVASGWFIRRGRPAHSARLRVMAVSACLVPLSPLIPLSGDIYWVFAVAMITVFAHCAWLASISTYLVDVVPAPIFGTAFGFIAAGSALGGILMNQVVVWTIAHFSYSYCFYAMAALHPVAFVLIWTGARQPWVLEVAPAQSRSIPS